MSLIKAAGSGEVSTGFYKHLLDQSLKFNNDDGHYLNRTPASAGNRKTWTWSGWLKRGDTSRDQDLFTATGSGAQLWANMISGDQIQVYGNSQVLLLSNALFRDVSAWYHIVFRCDTTQGTASNRLRVYVNGSELTSWATDNRANLTQDGDFGVNSTVAHHIGANQTPGNYLDGYLAEINFIDGTSLGPDSFGETKDGIWIPKSTSGLTFGTNGFHLTFKDDVVSEGFNTVTWTGTGQRQSVSGVGFSPALVWNKSRNASDNQLLVDSLRGASKGLSSNSTAAEVTSGATNDIVSFDGDGFTTGVPQNYSSAGSNNYNIVSWCWEAGGTPTADNSAGAGATPTAGSVKIDGSNLGSALGGSIAATRLSANTTKGFSVVSYTGNGSAGATVAHGLGATPKWIILKYLDGASNWRVHHTSTGTTHTLFLNLTNAKSTDADRINGVSSTTFTLATSGGAINGNGSDYIAYCWSEISGYSSFGSYTGNGSTTGPTVTTGFKPSVVIIKRVDATNNWIIQDTTRDPANPVDAHLYLNLSNTEDTGKGFNVSDTGFQISFDGDGWNASGGTYIYMAFADTREAAFFKDVTTNGNHWTPVNLDYRDSVPDTPTNNFATLNPLATSLTLSEGNLTASGGSTHNAAKSTMAITAGMKVYLEVTFGATPNGAWFGLTPRGDNETSYTSTDRTGLYSTSAAATFFGSGAGTGSITKLGSGEIWGMAVDFDDGRAFFCKIVDGTQTWYKRDGTTGSQYAPGGGTDNLFEFTNSDKTLPLFVIVANASTPTLNFGQDSSFAGAKSTANSNSDDNGHGSFQAAVPSGYLALCSQNLPDVDIIDGTDNFNTVLYTGNATDATAISGVGFSPDWTWIKVRNNTNNHRLFDTVRGAGKDLISNSTSAESTTTTRLQSFDSDGFTVGTNAEVNSNGHNIVAWNWLAGTAFSNDASATGVGTVDSAGQVNTKAGFSIVGYTGNATAGATIGHGLSSAPEMLILKNRDSALSWPVYHAKNTSAPETDYVYLDATQATVDQIKFWNDTAPTSTVFSIGDSSTPNSNGAAYIAYCFHSVEGYSKVGSYTGNSNANGTFVFTGFRPAWILIKRTTDGTYHWRIYDSKRSPFNEVDDYLSANLTNAEVTGLDIDFLSNGFKIRTSNDDINDASKNYIYLAFAEQPFKFANAR